MFGNAQKVEIKPEYRPTQEEINEYYKTHTLKETALRFHRRREALPIDPALKKGRRGAGKTTSMETEVQVVFLKSFTKLSNVAISRVCGIAHDTVALIERRNEALKNLFEEYKIQIGNSYGEYLLQQTPKIYATMDKLIETAERKTKRANLRDLVKSWADLHASMLECTPRESAVPIGDVDAKAQLMSAITAAIKAPEMDKQTAESIYYQPEEDEESILSDEQEMNDEIT